VKRYAAIILFVVSSLFAPRMSADEQVRQVQEEMRKRNLYYGEIDGRSTPELAEAVARYQQRKGFAATGAVDDPTLRSLGISAPAPSIAGDDLPDTPVLKSDLAVRARDFRYISLQPQPTATPVEARKPAPPPVRDQVSDLIRRYFAACETAAVNDELDFYADQIDYYDRGRVDKAFLQQDLTSYDQRWPNRRYILTSPVKITARGDKVVAKCRVSFGLATISSTRKAAGKSDQTFVLTPRGEGGWQIVSIKEVRVRPPSKSRGKTKKAAPLIDRAGNTLKNIFNTRDTKPHRSPVERP
jgi:hypothetical protein